MYVDALISNIEELAAEVRAYEDLKAGRVQTRSASLAELPTVLIRARVAHGWPAPAAGPRSGRAAVAAPIAGTD